MVVSQWNLYRNGNHFIILLLKLLKMRGIMWIRNRLGLHSCSQGVNAFFLWPFLIRPQGLHSPVRPGECISWNLSNYTVYVYLLYYLIGIYRYSVVFMDILFISHFNWIFSWKAFYVHFKTSIFSVPCSPSPTTCMCIFSPLKISPCSYASSRALAFQRTTSIFHLERISLIWLFFTWKGQLIPSVPHVAWPWSHRESVQCGPDLTNGGTSVPYREGEGQGLGQDEESAIHALLLVH